VSGRGEDGYAISHGRHRLQPEEGGQDGGFIGGGEPPSGANGPQLGPTNRKIPHLPCIFLLVKHWQNTPFHKTYRKNKPKRLRLIVQRFQFTSETK